MVMQMLKVWDINTGKKMFEFSANMGEGVIITAMDVDKAGKRYDHHVWLLCYILSLAYSDVDNLYCTEQRVVLISLSMPSAFNIFCWLV